MTPLKPTQDPAELQIDCIVRGWNIVCGDIKTLATPYPVPRSWAPCCVAVNVIILWDCSPGYFECEALACSYAARWLLTKTFWVMRGYCAECWDIKPRDIRDRTRDTWRTGVASWMCHASMTEISDKNPVEFVCFVISAQPDNPCSQPHWCEFSRQHISDTGTSPSSFCFYLACNLKPYSSESEWPESFYFRFIELPPLPWCTSSVRVIPPCSMKRTQHVSARGDSASRISNWSKPRRPRTRTASIFFSTGEDLFYWQKYCWDSSWIIERS